MDVLSGVGAGLGGKRLSTLVAQVKAVVPFVHCADDAARGYLNSVYRRQR